jgi:hypothetical protein
MKRKPSCASSSQEGFLSGRKGMLHYRAKIKQKSVFLVLEEYQTYAALTAN